jgi:hypothetical protein
VSIESRRSHDQQQIAEKLRQSMRNGTLGPINPSTLLRGAFSADGSSTISNNGVAELSWADLGAQGGPVLDLSNPSIGDPGSITRPSVLKTGVYTIDVQVDPNDALTIDGFFSLSLFVDFDGEGLAPIENDSRLATAAQPYPKTSISKTWYLVESATLRLLCRNRDGVAARRFQITSASVQQVV